MKSTKKQVAEEKEKEEIQPIEATETITPAEEVPPVKKRSRTKTKAKAAVLVDKTGDMTGNAEAVPETVVNTGIPDKEPAAAHPVSVATRWNS